MAEAASGEAKTPLATAAERIRGSAQWLLGAFAAVGAILAAGLQITSIGDLDTGDGIRFAVALAGVALAVLGIIIAVAAAASVATRSDVSLPILIQQPGSKAAEMVAADTALRQGLGLDVIQQRLTDAATSAGATYDAIVILGNPGSDATKQAQAAALRVEYDRQVAELNRMRRLRADILDVASFYRVKEAFGDGKQWMIGGAVAAAIGITAFAWGANAPEPKSLDGGTVLPKTPSEVTIILNAKGVQEFGPPLRKTEDCDLTKLSAIAFAVDHQTYDVVTVSTDDCNVVRMSVSADQGRVVPRVAAAAAITAAD